MTILLPQHQPHDNAAERLDAALRSNLVLDVPVDLAARLQMIMEVAQPSPLDAAIRSAVVVAPPVELVARLQALVPVAADEVIQPVVARRWVHVVYALTALTLGILLVFAGQFYFQILDQLGASALWLQVSALPSQLLDRLYEIAPRSQVVVDGYRALRQPLQWLLVGLVMWAVLDMRSGQRTPQVA